MTEFKPAGDLIREARECMGMSQATLAKELGLASGQSISNIERGVVALPIPYLVPVCSSLGLNRAQLVEALVQEYRDSIEQGLNNEDQNRH